MKRFDFADAGRRATGLILDSILAGICPFCAMESRTAHEDHCPFYEWSEEELRAELAHVPEEVVTVEGSGAVDRVQVLEAMLAKAASRLEEATIVLFDAEAADRNDLADEVVFIAEIRKAIGDTTTPHADLSDLAVEEEGGCDD